MCSLIESQLGGNLFSEGKQGFLLINSVYLKHPIALLVLIAVTSESSYSAIGQFCIIYEWNESLGVEGRCIENNVASAGLHNQHLGKQWIKCSTERKISAKNEASTC